MPPLHSPNHMLLLDHSPAPHRHRAAFHTLCCSTTQLSSPRLYATHDVASDTPLHASTPPMTLPPVHKVFLRKHITLFPPCAVLVRYTPSVLPPSPRIT
ncbi:hypothetical protein Pcinc_026443 [Petrolisthes cinctipes]|uniref:Uncharacterized protein n=1 Tax=Petrolisthes cinctipes TaxID=88211 RepID=A0AAE1BMU9_PETCI|nr:hypothetical protein Pcinc_039842 [Petrolisthes cinctipes]KAK3868145.1 hypothetical protein Pcinc_026443 [Petrolisthes cinctipes]